MEKKRLWYAVTDEDAEWGNGSFNRVEALAMAASWNEDEPGRYMVAVIDGDFDENGNETTDPICVGEIHADDDEMLIAGYFRGRSNHLLRREVHESMAPISGESAETVSGWSDEELCKVLYGSGEWYADLCAELLDRAGFDSDSYIADMRAADELPDLETAYYLAAEKLGYEI